MWHCFLLTLLSYVLNLSCFCFILVVSEARLQPFHSIYPTPPEKPNSAILHSSPQIHMAALGHYPGEHKGEDSAQPAIFWVHW